MCKFAVGEKVAFMGGKRTATVVAIVPQAKEYQRLVLVSDEGGIIVRSLDGKFGLRSTNVDVKKIPAIISNKIFRITYYNKKNGNLSELTFHLRSAALDHIERFQTENLVFGPVIEDTISIEITE